MIYQFFLYILNDISYGNYPGKFQKYLMTFSTSNKL